MKHIDIFYHLVDWRERLVFERADGFKVAAVDAAFEYRGGLEGKTVLSYIMRYDPSGGGEYDGWEKLEVDLAGSPGELILRHSGRFDKTGIDLHAESVIDSGLGSLAGRRFLFSARLSGHGPYPIRLELE